MRLLATVVDLASRQARLPGSIYVADKQQQRDELSALEAIYGDDCTIGADHTSCQVSDVRGFTNPLLARAIQISGCGV